TRLDFRSHWFGMQAPIGLGQHCMEAEQCTVPITASDGSAHDDSLLPHLKRAIADRKGRRLLIVLHLLGSHFSYVERYPRSMAASSPSAQRLLTRSRAGLS